MEKEDRAMGFLRLFSYKKQPCGELLFLVKQLMMNQNASPNLINQ